MPVRAVFDTNVLVDYLNRVAHARRELARYEERAISVVTWIEVMVGSKGEEEEAVLRSFLDGFDVVEVDREIAEEAVRLRRTYRMRVPDAIIWATARTRRALFITRNTKDFPTDDPGVRVPYSR
ncbi:MAG TPA: type II toxin-antitoxin system VapC family toxin [Vicinamibacteria bacterium]|jgi:hypothetical protein